MNSRHDVRSGEGWPGRYESKCVTGESVILRANAVVDPDCRLGSLFPPLLACVTRAGRSNFLSLSVLVSEMGTPQNWYED